MLSFAVEHYCTHDYTAVGSKSHECGGDADGGEGEEVDAYAHEEDVALCQ